MKIWESKETGKQFIVVLSAVIVGLAVHQLVVSHNRIKKQNQLKKEC